MGSDEGQCVSVWESEITDRRDNGDAADVCDVENVLGSSFYG